MASVLFRLYGIGRQQAGVDINRDGFFIIVRGWAAAGIAHFLLHFDLGQNQLFTPFPDQMLCTAL